MATPEWMPIAQSYVGLAEIAGSKDNEKIVEFFKTVGHSEIEDDETPWCSAFVGAVFHEVGIVGTGSLAARSWLAWGKALKRPSYGCVVVFKRGNSSWQGHVAFFIKEDDDYVWVLGGNQSDQVKVSKYSKKSVLGYRWPSTMGTSRTVVGAVTSGTSAAGVQAVEAIQKTQDTLMGIPLDIAKWFLLGLTLLSLGVVIYARWDDLRRKGR